MKSRVDRERPVEIEYVLLKRDLYYRCYVQPMQQFCYDVYVHNPRVRPHLFLTPISICSSQAMPRQAKYAGIELCRDKWYFVQERRNEIRD